MTAAGEFKQLGSADKRLIYEMATNKNTLNDLASDLGQPLAALMAAAELELGKPVTAHTRVTPNQEREIRKRLNTELTYGDQKPVELEGAARQIANLSRSTLRDTLPASKSRQLSELDHRVWYHEDVNRFLADHSSVRKRTNIALQQIIAFGRTNVIKGCSDTTNRGWLRSPLGGGGGMHYYLWWAPPGSRPIRELGFGTHDVVVRAIRHHDDHGQLLACGPTDSDNMVLERELLDGGVPELELPWTHDQLGFIDSDAPIRLAIGKPGSGKTTVLWKAVDTRADTVVLYATWSRQLTEQAEQHFKAFAPADSHILARDFTSLIGQICGRDIARRTLHDARADFTAALPHGSRSSLLGPWQDRKAALFAEVRAHLVGDVAPGSSRADIRKRLLRLLPDAYRSDRGKDDQLGTEAAAAVLRLVDEVESQMPLEKIFPELHAAQQAIEILRKGVLPAGFERVTRIVVDEIQDLTLLELSVFTEMCLAIRKVSKRLPFLLFAGDDGQSVRPSGFEWGKVSRLLREKLEAVPIEFHLEASVRYPARISRVIESASCLYKGLRKDRRPRKQRGSVNEEHRQAQLFHVAVEDRVVGTKLLQDLLDLDDVHVVVSGEEMPDWIRQGVGEGVLTTSEAKGLEFQSVCVVDPGRQLVELSQASQGQHAGLDEVVRRTKIDQLRVALSRATETLVFVDVEASAVEREQSRQVLGDSVSFSSAELLQHFAHPDATPEERVVGRINDARALLEDRPVRAWQLACQAFGLLGEAGLHNGVATRQVRVEAAEVCLAVASRFLSDGIPLTVSRQEIDDVAGDALQELDSKELESIFYLFADWAVNSAVGPFDLLEALSQAEINAPWLRSALSSKSQQISSAIQAGSRDGIAAARFAGNVEAWLKVCGFAGDAASESSNLRMHAVDALLNRKATKDAESVLSKILPADPVRLGRLREAQERWEDAAREFERGGASSDALRNWRAAANWPEAIRVARANAIEDRDLEWLSNLELLVHAQPNGLTGRLKSKAENDLLSRLARMANVSPSKQLRGTGGKGEGNG